MEESKNSLTKKMMGEIELKNFYEASQLAISFIARKKKNMGQNGTSSVVFHAAKLLIDNGGSADAGTLLAWFIEDGAGDEYKFHMETSATLSSTVYCDVQRLSDLLAGLEAAVAAPVVERVYGPVHVHIVKVIKKPTGALATRLESLEQTCATIFETTGNWLSAYKATVRLNDLARAARVLDQWSRDGYNSEKPLFFARALLSLLSDGHVSKAAELLRHSKPLVAESSGDNDKAKTAMNSASLASWHFALILTELAVQEPKPRVDKTKIFGVIFTRYMNILDAIDPRLIQLVEKAGIACFGVKPVQQQNQPNHMAFLQSMLGGGSMPEPPSQNKAIGNGGGGGGGNGPVDMKQILQMMRQMENIK